MFHRPMLGAAVAALALMGAPSLGQSYEPKRDEPQPRYRSPRKRTSRWNARLSHTKATPKRYKGSKAAKRATKRGGNPASH